MADIYSAGFDNLLNRELESGTSDSTLTNPVQPSQILPGSLDLGRIQILPDEVTGFLATDSDEGEVFKIITDGDDEGDVIIGDSAGQYAKWDKSTGTFEITGAITLNTTGYIKGGQTDYNTGTGFFLGYSTDAYKFSIGDPTGDYLIWDGANLYVNETKYIAGDILLASSDADTGIGFIDTYTLAKTIKIVSNGTLRIKFNLWKTGPSSTTAYARIYRNATPVGTEQTSTTTDPPGEAKSEDIAGWSKGDEVNLYIHGLVSPQTTSNVDDFRIYALTGEVSVATKDTV